MGSEQKGFFVALGSLMSSEWNVTFIAENKYTAEMISKHSKFDKASVAVLPERRLKPIVDEGTFPKAKLLEEKYSIKMSLLSSQDRALGYGYLLNVEKYPYIKRANWTHGEKLQSIVDQFVFFEQILSGIDLFISQWPLTIVSLIAEKRGVDHYHLSRIKYGNRYFWSNDNYQGSLRYRHLLAKHLNESDDAEVHQSTPYEIDARGYEVNKGVEYTYWAAVKRFSAVIIRDTLNSCLRRKKPNSYQIYGWATSGFRRMWNYRFVAQNSLTLPDIERRKIVYFPLHMEPEVALLQFAPEFNNTVEAIVWVSKALPADYLLVIKEQATGYSVRSKQFYRRLKSIPNVVLAHPSSDSWEWIRAAKFISTMTGTVGQEAVHFNKAVISFGRHQIINALPTVYHAESVEDVNKAIEILTKEQVSQTELARSRTSLYRSQIEISFELPGYKDTYKSNTPNYSDAEIAYKYLMTEYSISAASELRRL